MSDKQGSSEDERKAKDLSRLELEFNTLLDIAEIFYNKWSGVVITDTKEQAHAMKKGDMIIKYLANTKASGNLDDLVLAFRDGGFDSRPPREVVVDGHTYEIDFDDYISLLGAMAHIASQLQGQDDATCRRMWKLALERVRESAAPYQWGNLT